MWGKFQGICSVGKVLNVYLISVGQGEKAGKCGLKLGKETLAEHPINNFKEMGTPKPDLDQVSSLGADLYSTQVKFNRTFD